MVEVDGHDGSPAKPHSAVSSFVRRLQSGASMHRKRKLEGSLSIELIDFDESLKRAHEQRLQRFTEKKNVKEKNPTTLQQPQMTRVLPESCPISAAWC